MLNFTLRRIAIAVPTLLILVVITFALMEAAPGSPFATERGVPEAVLKSLEAKYGLDRPIWERMAIYVWNVVAHWDFGPSYILKDVDVNDIIAQGFPVTLTYGTWAFVAAVTVGVSLGVVAAVKQNSAVDYAAVGVTVGAQVLPNFVMAPILILVFTLWLGWLPGGGWRGGQWQYVIMPVIALSTSYMASIARITRASMLETLNSNFIRTARAKGLPMRRVILRHALKPALLPVVSYLGPTFVGMITGSVVVDIFFSTGGIGQFYAKSALSRDYGVMLGITILIGALTVLFNLLVDLIYAWIDPRIRY